MQSELPQTVRAFIGKYIDTLDQLEILLLFFHRPKESWSAEDVARELRLDPGDVRKRVLALHDRGFVSATESAQPRYAYSTESSELAQAVELLAREYASRRVAVITAIFSKPVDNVKTFAEAFRLKTEKDP